MSEDRLTDLEIKVSFQEKLISELDEVIQAMRRDLDALSAEVDRVKHAMETDRGTVVDEKPPHY